MPIPFSAEPKLINEIFGRDITYIIPEYQRPYSWECLGKSDRNNQVIQMWDDLYSHFLDRRQNNNDYFFGSIVLIDRREQTYEVIDGQQRLTTTLLLFAAIKKFLSGIETSDKELKTYIGRAITLMDEIIHNQRLFGADVSDRKLKIERSSGFNYDDILTTVVTGEAAPDMRTFTKEQQQVVERYFKNRDYFASKLSESFLNNGAFGTEQARALNEFIEYLKSKVSFVRILAGNFSVAYHVFEILNNRGLPLSNKDLLRNFIIKEFEQIKQENPKKYTNLNPNQKWNEIDDLTDDFIGRWVESFTATQQRTSAFNDLKEIYTNNFNPTLASTRIELFFEKLKQDLGYYNDIININSSNPIIRSKLKFILSAPNVRYGMNFLLALSKYLQGLDREPERTIDFLIEYEKFMFSAFMYRFNYGPVYTMIVHLNENDPNAIGIFRDGNTLTAEVIPRLFNIGFHENEIAKLLIAKYIWINEAITNEDVVEQKLIYDNATLEHIIPQNPDPNTNWVTDFTEQFRIEFTYRLGNMTLLTTRRNSAAKNYDFQRKKIQYARTKLPLTVEIANLERISEDYITNREARIVNAIIEDLRLN